MDECKLEDKQLWSPTKRNRLNSFFRNFSYTDCTFTVKKMVFKAHKLILATSSPVFEKMFYGDLATNEVCIPDIEPTCFKLMLEFVYMDNINLKSVQEAWNVFIIGDRYLMDDLMNFCAYYIERNLTLSTLLLSYEYSEMLYVDKLRTKCRLNIQNYTEGVLLSEYHMKPNTLFSLVEDFDKLNIQICDLVVKVIEWAVVECEQNETKVSSGNIINTLKDFNLLQFTLKYCDSVSVLSNLSEIVFACLKYLKSYAPFGKLETRVLHKSFGDHLLIKMRQTYKIARKVDISQNAKVRFNFSTNKKVAIFSIALNTESSGVGMPPWYEGVFDVNIFPTKNSNNLLKPHTTNVHKDKVEYHSVVYVPLKPLIFLEPERLYTIEVGYTNLDLSFNEKEPRFVIFHYMSQLFYNKYTGVEFNFTESLGTVVRGLSYYPA